MTLPGAASCGEGRHCSSLPEIVEAVAEPRATRGDDGVGVRDAPVPASASVVRADGGIAALLKDSGGDTDAPSARLGESEVNQNFRGPTPDYEWHAGIEPLETARS